MYVTGLFFHSPVPLWASSYPKLNFSQSEHMPSISPGFSWQILQATTKDSYGFGVLDFLKRTSTPFCVGLTSFYISLRCFVFFSLSVADVGHTGLISSTESLLWYYFLTYT